MADQKNRRASTFAQAAAYTLIVIAILGTLNFLANRYNKSYDSTSNKKFTLSDQTAKIVKNLQQNVTITYWDRPTGFQNARDLLDRYKNLSPKVDAVYEDVDKRRTQMRSLPPRRQGITDHHDSGRQQKGRGQEPYGRGSLGRIGPAHSRAATGWFASRWDPASIPPT